MSDVDPRPQKRQFERISDTLTVSYRIEAGVEPAITETYDIGRGGCAILTTVELDEGQPLFVALELRAGTIPPLELAAAVRWSQYDRLLDRWKTGVEFVHRTPAIDSELQRYIETLRRLRNLGAL